jgi:hypothetical protein
MLNCCDYVKLLIERTTSEELDRGERVSNTVTRLRHSAFTKSILPAHISTYCKSRETYSQKKFTEGPKLDL